MPLARASALVGLAGSVTTLTAHALGLAAYDPDRIHLASLPVDRVDRGLHRPADHDPRRARGPGVMHPGRVDVIGAGALVWRRVVEHVQREAGITEVVTSEHDILDGIALSCAE